MTTLPTTVRERIDLPSPPPTASASGPGDASVSFQDIMSIVKRRMFLITFLFLFFSSLAVGGWLAAYFYAPLYPGEAFVKCVSNQPKGTTIYDRELSEREFERFIMTQALFAKSPDVLFAVLQSAEVRATEWYKNTPGDRREIEIFDLVQAAPQRGTNLLKISVETSSPADPHVIANQVVRHYLQRVKEHNTDEFRHEREVYQKEIEAVQGQIVDRQEQLGNVQTKLPPGWVSGAGNTSADEYREILSVVTQYEQMTLELEGLHKMYTNPSRPALSPEDTQLVDMDPKVATLSNQYFQLAQNLKVMKKQLGARHRSVGQAEDFLQVVNEQLEKERESKLAQILAYRQQQVETAFNNMQYALILAKEQLADSEAKMADMDQVASQYLTLQEDIDVLKENREVLGGHLRELDRIIQERTAVRIEVQQTAIEPLQRSFPQKFLIPAGVALSMVFAVGIALLLELIDTSLRTPQDVVRYLRIPLLGAIPDADDEEVDIDPIEMAVRDAPHSMFAEVFRSIRTNLQFAAPADRQRTVVITSPRPEDGKTTVACNLAMMVAQGGRRVLLVDANFRRPAIHRFFESQSSRGLSNILVGDGKLSELAVTTNVTNLEILGAGPLQPNPAELLGSEQMVAFLAEASEMYDQVIFDCPPVLLASDACVLASKTDGVILVCRAKTNSRGIGSRAAQLLTRMDAHVFGAVLNAVQTRRGGYFREQLKTFYDYSADEKDTYQAYRAELPAGEDISERSDGDGSGGGVA